MAKPRWYGPFRRLFSFLTFLSCTVTPVAVGHAWGRRYNRPMARSFRPSRRHRPGATKSAVEDVVKAARAAASARQQDYRARSLAIHGWICAKCAREFDESNLHLLTVHHKDGNHNNNPPDGSNWENLCAYCHEDEHSRGILADYLAGKD